MGGLSLIRRAAARTGLDLLGVTPPRGAPAAQRGFERWIASGRHGEMRYLERHAPAKTDAAALLPGCAAVIVVGLSYNRRPVGASHPAALAAVRAADAARRSGPPAAAGRSGAAGRIAMYAWGRDYHRVLRRKLRDLIGALAGALPDERFRWGADATPLLETHFAARAGLGFQGKHTLLIHRRLGSWFVIGEVLTTAPLPATPPPQAAGAGPRCGAACNHCRDVCPTGALDDEWRIDARRCISYLTIEHKGAIPVELRPLIGDWLFGCDLCQEVCPWNVRAAPAGERDFLADRAGPAVGLAEVLAIRDHEQLAARFAGTPLMRAGRRGLVRNACVVAANVRAHHLFGALRALTADRDPVVAEHARWACDRLRASAGAVSAEAAPVEAGLAEDAAPARAGAAP